MAAVDPIAYQDLAAVYDWLVPETLLTPEGSAAMFEPQIARIEPGRRVLGLRLRDGNAGGATCAPPASSPAAAPTPTRPSATW